jgi:hypothetical protein
MAGLGCGSFLLFSALFSALFCACCSDLQQEAHFPLPPSTQSEQYAEELHLLQVAKQSEQIDFRHFKQRE